MKIIYEYSHLGGGEILQLRYADTLAKIYEVVSLVEPRTAKISKEKTKIGRNLVSPKDLNSGFKERFTERGFHELRDKYTITIPNSPTRIRGAFKQVDFVKDLVLVEVQFGKYAFMFYDMAKFQYFFNQNQANVGVEIVPCNTLKRRMSSGVSYGEQLVYDIERLKRTFPAVPVLVILIDSDVATPTTE